MKPNLILLHGALGTETQMRKLEEHFMSHYKVFRFTFYGHGENANVPSFSIQQLVAQLKEFVKTHHLMKFSIFGYSMGGYVALKYAMEAQTGIENIFTFGTKFNWTRENASKEVLKLNPELIEQKIPHFADWLKKQHGEHWKKVVLNTADMMHGLGENNPLASDDLSKINCLVTLSLGSADTMVTQEETLQMTNRLNRARLLILNNTGHDLSTLQPIQIKEITGV
ncbi:MAG: alpha/beta hydrolase [Bacteroidetes bacterium]|nr:alpha/beta hydrolase [Bacteroidota bacterium]